MRENVDQDNSEYGHFLCSAIYSVSISVQTCGVLKQTHFFQCTPSVGNNAQLLVTRNPKKLNGAW